MSVLRKAFLDGKVVNVVSYNELNKHRELYEEQSTGITVKTDTESYILPYRNCSVQSAPGVYPLCKDKGLDLFVFPINDEDKVDYQPEVIDFGNSVSMQEYLARQDRFKDIERDILTNPDNIFTPKPGPNDTPEMKGLKEAVAAKKIDIDKYADRFGDNFSNAKRKMRDESVSLLLLKRIVKQFSLWYFIK